MPKLKTRSGAKKRFVLKKSGKVKYRHAGVRHLATFGKSKKERVQLRGTSHLGESDAKKIKECLPYGR